MGADAGSAIGALAGPAEWGEDQIAFMHVDMPGDANSAVTIQRAAGGSLIGDAMHFEGATGEHVNTTSGAPNAALGFAGTMTAAWLQQRQAGSRTSTFVVTSRST